MTKFLNTLSVTVIAVSLLGAAPAEAARSKKDASPAAAAPASPATPATPAAAPVEWELKNTFGKWELLCNKGNASDCRAVQTQNYSDDTTKGRLLQALLATDQGRTFTVLTLPFGVDLRAGTVIKIDEGVEVKAAYTTCLPDGCQSVVELDESLQGQLIAGKVMKVGFRPWGGDDKTLVVEVPLDGAKDVVAAIKK
jgi:invasion protein IalB